ncbi:hypothetical protein [uncultured Chryseobacterium sp.]|uniref:hypothetical protein n=1 Tax=uncultured Chryseobacterium sp. TaxID=259322 RepID=UPI0025F6B1D4|nr:hypothetical protein [uncultured Chryseobacterium sp.]
MNEFINKSFEYTDVVAGKEYKIKVSIISAPENIEISNVDTTEAKGFVFNIAVSTEPQISGEYFETAKQYVYVFGREGEHQFGSLENGSLVESIENRFIQLLIVHIQEILMITGNQGHFFA